MSDDLNAFFYTDDVDDVMAAYVNQLVAGNLRGELTNTETLTANKTMTDGSLPIQDLTPSGANRNVFLAPEAISNHLVFFRNASGTFSLVIKDDSGVTTVATILPGETGLLVPIGGTAWAKIVAPTAPSAYNYLINGGFHLAQRTTPGTLTTIAQDKYGPDRWRSSRENSDLAYQRVDGLAEAGLTSEDFGTYKKATNVGKFMIYQIIEGANSVPLRGKTVTFQFQGKVSSAKTMRVAVLELQNAGTINSIPATFVSAWGANSTDPTLGSNLAIVTAAQSKSLTTAMQVFSITVAIPSNSKNVIVAIWSDSQFAVNDTFSIGEAGIYIAGAAQPWAPRHRAQELLLCQRHFWKTFDLDTQPASGASSVGGLRSAQIVAASTAQGGNYEWFPTPMFATPTITLYNPVSANAQAYNVTVAADCSATASAPGALSARTVGINFTSAVGSAIGNANVVQVTAEAEL